MKRELSGNQLKALVEQQLGRPASISFTVAAICSYGWPAVISSRPFREDGSPNPNILYLTCPYLRRELAVLEDRGAIREFEELLVNDESLTADLVAAQRRHARAWRNVAGAVWPGAPQEAPRIAAASGDMLLKCLHAHMAWYLVHADYKLGWLLARRVGDCWCGDDLCASFDLGETG